MLTASNVKTKNDTVREAVILNAGNLGKLQSFPSESPFYRGDFKMQPTFIFSLSRSNPTCQLIHHLALTQQFAHVLFSHRTQIIPLPKRRALQMSGVVRARASKDQINNCSIYRDSERNPINSTDNQIAKIKPKGYKIIPPHLHFSNNL